jgi:hypothetical protein
MMKVNKLTIEEILKHYNDGVRFDINNGEITRITVLGITTK